MKHDAAAAAAAIAAPRSDAARNWTALGTIVR